MQEVGSETENLVRASLSVYLPRKRSTTVLRRADETLNAPELRIEKVAESLALSEKLQSVQWIGPCALDGVSNEEMEKVLVNVHDFDYLEFLKMAWDSANAANDADWFDSKTGTLVPNHFARRLPSPWVPIYKRAGYYGSDVMSPIRSETWSEVLESAKMCVAASNDAVLRDVVESVPRVRYVLTSAPGHHAGRDRYGGYCFLNNPALVATQMIRLGLKNVGILDVDFHAGDGILEFAARAKNVAAVSIHADPKMEYPSFSGMPQPLDEIGSTLSLIAPNGCVWSDYERKLLEAIEFLKPNNDPIRGLVIAFGADTFADDHNTNPNVRFKLAVEDYRSMGRLISRSFGGIPIVVTQEGGYCLEKLGAIVENFLFGLIEAPF